MNIISKRKIKKYKKNHKSYPIFICNSCAWKYDCISVATKYVRCKGYEYASKEDLQFLINKKILGSNNERNRKNL